MVDFFPNHNCLKLILIVVRLYSPKSPKTYPCLRQSSYQEPKPKPRSGVPLSCCLPPVNVNRPLSITPIQTHLIQLLSEGGRERLEGMQINPQVNTNIIRSVTLQHCPTGMCEFHLEGSQMGDNSGNQVPSERPLTQMWAQKTHTMGNLLISTVSSRW